MVNEFVISIINLGDDWLLGFVQRHRISNAQELLVQLQHLAEKIKLITNYSDQISAQQAPEKQKCTTDVHTIKNVEYKGKNFEINIPADLNKDNKCTQSAWKKQSEQLAKDFPIPQNSFQCWEELYRRFCDPKQRNVLMNDWVDYFSNKYNLTRDETLDILDAIELLKGLQGKEHEKRVLMLIHLQKIVDLQTRIKQVYHL